MFKRGASRLSCDSCHKRKVKCDRPQRLEQGFDKCTQCETRQLGWCGIQVDRGGKYVMRERDWRAVEGGMPPPPPGAGPEPGSSRGYRPAEYYPSSHQQQQQQYGRFPYHPHQQPPPPHEQQVYHAPQHSQRGEHHLNRPPLRPPPPSSSEYPSHQHQQQHSYHHHQHPQAPPPSSAPRYIHESRPRSPELAGPQEEPLSKRSRPLSWDQQQQQQQPQASSYYPRLDAHTRTHPPPPSATTASGLPSSQSHPGLSGGPLASSSVGRSPIAASTAASDFHRRDPYPPPHLQRSPRPSQGPVEDQYPARQDPSTQRGYAQSGVTIEVGGPRESDRGLPPPPGYERPALGLEQQRPMPPMSASRHPHSLAPLDAYSTSSSEAEYRRQQPHADYPTTSPRARDQRSLDPFYSSPATTRLHTGTILPPIRALGEARGQAGSPLPPTASPPPRLPPARPSQFAHEEQARYEEASRAHDDGRVDRSPVAGRSPEWQRHHQEANVSPPAFRPGERRPSQERYEQQQREDEEMQESLLQTEAFAAHALSRDNIEFLESVAAAGFGLTDDSGECSSTAAGNFSPRDWLVWEASAQTSASPRPTSSRASGMPSNFATTMGLAADSTSSGGPSSTSAPSPKVAVAAPLPVVTGDISSTVEQPVEQASDPSRLFGVEGLHRAALDHFTRDYFERAAICFPVIVERHFWPRWYRALEATTKGTEAMDDAAWQNSLPYLPLEERSPVSTGLILAIAARGAAFSQDTSDLQTRMITRFKSCIIGSKGRLTLDDVQALALLSGSLEEKPLSRFGNFRSPRARAGGLPSSANPFTSEALLRLTSHLCRTGPSDSIRKTLLCWHVFVLDGLKASEQARDGPQANGSSSSTENEAGAELIGSTATMMGSPLQFHRATELSYLDLVVTITRLIRTIGRLIHSKASQKEGIAAASVLSLHRHLEEWQRLVPRHLFWSDKSIAQLEEEDQVPMEHRLAGTRAGLTLRAHQAVIKMLEVHCAILLDVMVHKRGLRSASPLEQLVATSLIQSTSYHRLLQLVTMVTIAQSEDILSLDSTILTNLPLSVIKWTSSKASLLMSQGSLDLAEDLWEKSRVIKALEDESRRRTSIFDEGVKEKVELLKVEVRSTGEAVQRERRLSQQLSLTTTTSGGGGQTVAVLPSQLIAQAPSTGPVSIGQDGTTTSGDHDGAS